MKMSDDVSDVKKKQQIVAQTIKKIASKFNPVEEIRKIYSNRIIDAIYFNRKFNSDRRAYGEFLGMDAIKDLSATINNFMKRINKPRLKNWGDIFIVYMVDEKPENLEEAHKIMQARPIKHPRVMVALPRQSANIGGHLLLYKTIKHLLKVEEDETLKKEWEKKYKELKSDLKGLIHWENWNWFYMGGVIEKQKDVTENGVISIFMEKLYPGSIDPGIRALGHHHSLTKRDRKLVRNAIDRILNVYSPIIISKERGDLASIILRKVTNLGILTRVSGAGWEEEWEVRQEATDDSPIKDIWENLYRDVLGKAQAGEEVSFSNVLKMFKAPPYGTTSALLKIIFSLFWRRYHQQMKLYNYGHGVRKEKGRLTFQRLTSMLSHPKNWKIGPRHVAKDEQEYLRGLIQIFTPGKYQDEVYDSLRETAKKSMMDWYSGIPDVILREVFEDSRVPAFLKMITQHKDKNGQEICMKYIPSTLGFKPDEMEFSKQTNEILKNLFKVVKTINRKSADIVNDLWKKLVKLFSLPGDNNKIEEIFKKWLDEISAEKYKQSYRGDCKVLYEILTRDKEKDIRKRLLLKLPLKLGMGSIIHWDMNRTPELIARLKKAQYQMSVMPYLELKGIGDHKKKREFIGIWLEKVFRDLDFQEDELESFLEGYLEEIVG